MKMEFFRFGILTALLAILSGPYAPILRADMAVDCPGGIKPPDYPRIPGWGYCTYCHDVADCHTWLTSSKPHWLSEQCKKAGGSYSTYEMDWTTEGAEPYKYRCCIPACCYPRGDIGAGDAEVFEA